jgi:hypothetical protein
MTKAMDRRTGGVMIESLVRVACREATVWDPEVIAKTVVGRVPADRRDVALLEAVLALVTRRGGAGVKSTSVAAAIGDAYSADGALVPQKKGVTRSRRWEAALATWESYLERWVALDEGGQHRVRMGDLTVQQVREAAALRSNRAAALRVEAERFLRLADAMETHRVGTLRKLPPGVFAAVWGDGARP